MTTTERLPVAGTDPRTGTALSTTIVESSPAEVRATTAAALAATPALADRGRRAGLLRSLGDALESARDRIVEVADAETALGVARLNGELTRKASAVAPIGPVAGRRSGRGPIGVGPAWSPPGTAGARRSRSARRSAS